MRWRTALGAFLGILLPMPLVLLLASVMHPGQGHRQPGGRQISPVLEEAERARRLSYGRDCTRKEDCEPPLGCFLDTSRRRAYCTDSQCRTNEDCREDEECRALSTFGGGPLVRFCAPWGVRTEGQHCVDLPDEKTEVCAPGLMCAGKQGFCARGCRMEDATSCPEGFFCADVFPRPACLPTCEARGCPEGQECIRYKDGTSVCEKVYGPQCQRTPCSDGRHCEVMAEPRSPGTVWMECITRCGKGHPACPEGFTCNRWRCMPSCEPGAPHACAEGYRCEQRDEQSPWVCQPDW